MNNFLKRVQKLDIFWKKAIVFTILIGLALFLFVFIINNIQKRMSGVEKKDLFWKSNLPNIQGLTQNLKNTLENMEKEFQIEFGATSTEMATTTTATTTNEQTDDSTLLNEVR